MKYMKAYLAGAVALLGSLVAGLQGDDTALTLAEWLTAIITGLVAGGGVAGIGNKRGTTR